MNWFVINKKFAYKPVYTPDFSLKLSPVSNNFYYYYYKHFLQLFTFTALCLDANVMLQAY